MGPWGPRDWWGPYYGHGCYGAGVSGCWGAPYAAGMTRSTWGADYMYSGSTPASRPSYVPTRIPGDDKPAKPNLSSARIVIDVPANAKLYVDDQLMKTGSGERLFYTPALSADETYFYDVRIEYVKNGQTVSESKKVLVRAGDMVRQTFKGLGEPTAVAATGKK